MNVLVCVDRSEISQKSVRYVADMLAPRGGRDEVTLFHVAEFLPEFVLSDHPEPGLTTRSLAERWAARAESDGDKLLAEQKDVLLKAGLPAAKVVTKLARRDCLPESRKVSAALAIIEELKTGNYDAVCVGRRGASDLALTFLGSVAEKIVREAQGKTVWIVG